MLFPTSRLRSILVLQRPSNIAALSIVHSGHSLNLLLAQVCLGLTEGAEQPGPPVFRKIKKCFRCTVMAFLSPQHPASKLNGLLHAWL